MIIRFSDREESIITEAMQFLGATGKGAVGDLYKTIGRLCDATTDKRPYPLFLFAETLRRSGYSSGTAAAILIASMRAAREKKTAAIMAKRADTMGRKPEREPTPFSFLRP